MLPADAPRRLRRRRRLLEHQHSANVAVVVEVHDTVDAVDLVTQRDRGADLPVRLRELAHAEVVAVLRVQPEPVPAYNGIFAQGSKRQARSTSDEPFPV